MDQAILNSVAVYASGEVMAGAREQVRTRVAGFLARLPDCWCSARVRLATVDRTVERRNVSWAALAQANLEFKGQPVRAQVAARSVAEAGRLLVDRLAEQLDRLANPTQPRPWPPTAARSEPVPRPAEQRRTVRAKRYRLTRCDPEQAALLMDIGDHDFYLFTDTTARTPSALPDAEGVDAVIYRVGPTGYRLARLDGLVPPPPESTLPITSSVHPVPRYTLVQAAAQLGATDSRFLFFRHASTGRGVVLYRRYDGHHGLLTAAGAEEARVVTPLQRWSRRDDGHDNGGHDAGGDEPPDRH